jgi:hypothetical protein
MRKSKQYKFKATDTLEPRTINPVIEDIDLRTSQLEDQAGAIQETLGNINDIALGRINEILVPAAEKIQQLTSLGFLIARSASIKTLVVSAVPTLFIVADGASRDLFTPSPFLAIERQNTTDDYAVARLIAYNRDNGELLVEVLAVYGNPGPHNDWTITASPGVSETVRQQLATTQAVRDNVIGIRDAAIEAITAIAQEADDARDIAVNKAGAASDSAALAQAATQLYLGPAFADPTTGRGGGPLVQGNWYLRVPTDAELAANPLLTARVRVLSKLAPPAWIDAASPANFIPVHRYITATFTGQTVFTLDSGFDGAAVLLAGAPLVPVENYTLASPSVTLTRGAVAGQILTVLGWQYRTTPAGAGPYYTQAEMNVLLAQRDATIAANNTAANAAIAAASDPAFLRYWTR